MKEEKSKLTTKQKVIIGCLAGAVVGVSVYAVVKTKHCSDLRLEVASLKNAITNVGCESVVNNNYGNVINVFERIGRGHPGNAVFYNETKQVFKSQIEAVAALGVTPDTVSKHLRGLKDNVNGFTLSRIAGAIPEDLALAA